MLPNFSHSCNVDVVLPEAPFYGTISSAATQSERHQPLVLVVDDERMIADSVSFILKRNGFAVLTAYDARSALEIARRVPPDLLLSDITMRPEMNGVDLAMEMVNLAPECKILLFSGQAGTMDILGNARRAGHSFTLLAKPVHPTDLLAYVAQSLDDTAMQMAAS